MLRDQGPNGIDGLALVDKPVTNRVREKCWFGSRRQP